MAHPYNTRSRQNSAVAAGSASEMRRPKDFTATGMDAGNEGDDDYVDGNEHIAAYGLHYADERRRLERVPERDGSGERSGAGVSLADYEEDGEWRDEGEGVGDDVGEDFGLETRRKGEKDGPLTMEEEYDKWIGGIFDGRYAYGYGPGDRDGDEDEDSIGLTKFGRQEEQGEMPTFKIPPPTSLIYSGPELDLDLDLDFDLDPDSQLRLEAEETRIQEQEHQEKEEGPEVQSRYLTGRTGLRPAPITIIRSPPPNTAELWDQKTATPQMATTLQNVELEWADSGSRSSLWGARRSSIGTPRPPLPSPYPLSPTKRAFIDKTAFPSRNRVSFSPNTAPPANDGPAAAQPFSPPPGTSPRKPSSSGRAAVVGGVKSPGPGARPGPGILKSPRKSPYLSRRSPDITPASPLNRDIIPLSSADMRPGGKSPKSMFERTPSVMEPLGARSTIDVAAGAEKGAGAERDVEEMESSDEASDSEEDLSAASPALTERGIASIRAGMGLSGSGRGAGRKPLSRGGVVLFGRVERTWDGNRDRAVEEGVAAKMKNPLLRPVRKRRGGKCGRSLRDMVRDGSFEGVMGREDRGGGRSQVGREGEAIEETYWWGCGVS